MYPDHRFAVSGGQSARRMRLMRFGLYRDKCAAAGRGCTGGERYIERYWTTNERRSCDA
jgi:hypothetical protein